jgi:hypothetical protein
MNTYFVHTLLFLISRYLHIVCATLLVGGTLFYEMVVPPAIDELRLEQQLLIFAKARIFFKWIVWISSLTLLLSGSLTSYAHWNEYTRDQVYRVDPSTPGHLPPEWAMLSPVARPGWWWAAHVSCGILAILISLSLTIGKVPPSRPIRWMRLNLIILLVVIFFATVARQTRLEAGSPPTQGVEPRETAPR